MGELGGRPDTPSEEPDKPTKAPDRARAPDTPSDSNNDPRAVWRTIRASDHPAFADPRVDVRYVTDRNPDVGPASVRPYRTSKDRPEPEHDEPERSDDRDRRPVDFRDPSGEELLEAADKPKTDSLREALVENIEDLGDSLKEAVDTIDGALARPSPTGQYTQVRPHQTDMHPSVAQGVDAGTGAAAMLATGLAMGELARLAYRKAAELKGRRDARIG